MKDNAIQLFNSDTLVKAKEINWYWSETIKQIAKDFEREDLLEVDVNEEQHPLQFIVKLLKPLILEFLEQRLEYFFSILYRIDIPEKQIKSLLPLDKSERALEDLTEIIIEREFLKVLIKDYIKNQKLRSDV